MLEKSQITLTSRTQKNYKKLEANTKLYTCKLSIDIDEYIIQNIPIHRIFVTITYVFRESFPLCHNAFRIITMLPGLQGLDLKILRSIRVLRPLKLVSRVPSE